MISGVTKRELNTALSRPGSPFHVQGNAIICCAHGRTRRGNKDAFIGRPGRVVICVCCENMYEDPHGRPGLCRSCRPYGAS